MIVLLPITFSTLTSFPQVVFQFVPFYMVHGFPDFPDFSLLYDSLASYNLFYFDLISSSSNGLSWSERLVTVFRFFQNFFLFCLFSSFGGGSVTRCHAPPPPRSLDNDTVRYLLLFYRLSTHLLLFSGFHFP